MSRSTNIPEVNTLGFPTTWRGAVLKDFKVYLPAGISNKLKVEDFTLKNFVIGSGGFSGEIISNWSGTKKTELFGMGLRLKKVGLKFMQNSLIGSEIKGELHLNFFNQPIDVDIGFDLNGNFSVAIDKPDGLLDFTYKTDDTKIFNVKIGNLGFEQKGSDFFVFLDGEIKPLIGGLDWPSFKVDELRIDSDGNVQLDGGWLNLREQYSLDFYGFQFEIVAFGCGNTEDGGKWIGFSGSLKLVDGLPAGGSVEGLRITWYEDGRNPGITFNGVGVEFEVPEVLRFKGAVAYRELPNDVHRFDGAIKLELTTLDLEIDGQLVVGKAEGFTFFAIYLGMELPAGIPLWSTGLGLYGMAGLFSYQMEPGKKKDERWYGIGKEKSYYHRAPEGVVQLAKWIEKQDSLGLGAGVTIGTISDNGYVFSGKVILALVFPGPQIFIEGKANLLKERSKLDEEPIFRALAVLDNREGTFLIGVDAEYKYGNEGELIEIGASAEAFFSLSDAAAWHLYLGENEPRDKRIRARIFKLFESNSYLMLDANQLAFGSWVGFDERWKFGPLRLTLEAWIENNVKVSWKPGYLYGDLSLHGKAELAIWWFELGLGLDALIAAQVFDPFHLLGKFSVSINLPWPLPDPSATIELEWGPEPDAPPLPLPLKEVAIEHAKVTTAWSLPRGGSQPLLLPNYDVDKDGYLDAKTPPAVSKTFKPSAIPVVPLDCRPQITFSRPVHDDAKVGSNPQPQVPEYEQIGDPEKEQGPVKIRYGLKEIYLEKWVDTKKDWDSVAWAKKTDKKNLYGSWAPIPAMPDKGGKVVAQTKLRLWSKTPFDYTRHGGSAFDEWFTDRFSDYPCIKIPPDREICYDFENVDASGPLISPWRHPEERRLNFYWIGKDAPSIESLSATAYGRTKGLCYADPEVVTETKIFLPQPAKKVTIIASAEDLVQVWGYNSQGQKFGPASQTNPSGVQSAVLTGIDIDSVIVHGYLRICIIAVCITVGLSEDEIVRRQEMEKHLKDELARWEQKDDILEPYTTYRLKVITTLESKQSTRRAGGFGITPGRG